MLAGDRIWPKTLKTRYSLSGALPTERVLCSSLTTIWIRDSQAVCVGSGIGGFEDVYNTSVDFSAAVSLAPSLQELAGTASSDGDTNLT